MTWAFFALVGYLLWINAREIAWGEVAAALSALPAWTLAAAALLTIASYGVYTCYDLLSRHYVGHDLPAGRVLATTFVSYAFNLNLGALVGGLGFRQRLYARQGLATGAISRIIVFSMWTNWFGYLTLAGAAFLLHRLELPGDWQLGGAALRILGAALLAGSAGYLSLCAFSRRREWTVRGHRIRLPALRLALLQLTLAAGNWALIGVIVWTLLQFRAPYPTVLSVLLIAAVAGVVTHVPAGLGVLEAVFVALLAGGAFGMTNSEVLGALLGYRAIYYLTPLAIAVAVYFGLEARIAGDAVPSGGVPAGDDRGGVKAPSRAAAARW
ncbi:MAG: lysylphosphatidylglycerol synthase domain-containing protein [Lautropia sp.]